MHRPRRRYQPSGRLDVGRFLPLAVGVLTVASGIGWLLWLGFERRFYVPLLFPCAGGVAVGSLALLAVRWGHCRSTPGALLLGLVAALTLAPGPYVLAYLADESPEAGFELGGWLGHIDQRFGRTSIDWGPTPKIEDWDPKKDPGGGDRVALWIAWALEIPLVLVAVAVPPVFRVWSLPYCEASRRWTRRRRLAFLPQAAENLSGGLEERRLGEVAPQMLVAFHPNRKLLLGLLDTCPDPTCTGAAGYLSLRLSEGVPAATLAFDDLFPYHRLRPRCAELDRTEVRALEALIPGEESAGTATVGPSWLDFLETPVPGAVVAEIENVVQPHPPPVTARGTRLRAEVLNLGYIAFLPILGLGMLWLGAGGDSKAPLSSTPLVASGIATMLIGLAFLLRDPYLAAHRYLLGRLAARLAVRSGALLRPGDPDTLNVELVPRGAWNAPDVNERIDYGIFAVRGGAILFEGDRLRMRIPAASLVSMALEPMVVDQYHKLFFVVLEVWGREGRHTLPFVRIACPLGETLFRGRKRRAQVLLERVLRLVENP